MSRFDYNNLLFQISKKLDEINVVEQIRVMCRELVAASHTTTFPLFEELEEKGYLSSDHLEVLKAMLRNVKEWNLLDDVKKFEYNRKEYDNVLGQVIRVFDGPNDLERLLLICKESIPEERQASIHTVRSLLKELENNQRLGIYCLGTLKEILTHTEKRDLLKEVEGFEQRQSRDLEFEKRKEQAAAITSSAIEKLAGVLNVKTVFKVAVGGLTIASSLAMLTRDSTYDQLILAVNTCVLPTGATLIQISDGCVCLKVQVESLAALETLWSLYQGGTLKETLQALLVTDEMRDLAIAGGKQIEAIVTIDEQEYEKVRNKLANQAQEDPDGKGERRLKYLNQEKYDYVQSYLEQIKDVDSHSVSDSGFCGSITSSSEAGTEDTNEDDPSYQEERSENHSPKQTFQQLKESVTPLPPTVSKSGTSELHTTAQKRPASFEKPSRKEHEESKATQIRQTSQGARPKERNSVTTESNDKAGKDVDGNEKEQTFGSHLPKQTLQQRGFSPLPERVAKSVTPGKSELNTSLSKVPTPTRKESFEGPKRKLPEERTTAQIRPVSQEAGPKERSSVTTESTPKGTKDLAILGCCVSKRYITDAIQAIESVRPTLNLHAQPSDFTSLVQVKRYLEGHSLQFCVLVVDGEAIRDAYGNLPEQRDEYEDLLKTAVERVGTTRYGNPTRTTSLKPSLWGELWTKLWTSQS